MKFSCGLTREGVVAKYKARAEELKKWKRIFLWIPETTHSEDGRAICQWLVSVERSYPSAKAVAVMLWAEFTLTPANVGHATISKGKPQYREITNGR